MCCALLLLCGLGSCSKQVDPPESNGNPLFTMQGTANGIPFLLQGGVSDYYMFTQTPTLEYGLLALEGKLAKQPCPETCGPSLKIYFRNYTLNSSFVSDSLFQKGQYVYYNLHNAQHWVYELRTHQRSTGNGSPRYDWDFGNNRFSKAAEPVVLFPEGIYPVTCSAVFPDNCLSNLTQSIYLTPSRVGKRADFSVNHLDTFELMFNSIPVNNKAQVTWNFGDGNTATGNIVKHRYQTGGVYKVKMQYVDGNDTMEYCQNVKTLNITKCLSNYYFTTSRRMDSLQYKTVVIEWTDKDGIVYSSANSPQENSLFELQSIEPFQLNNANQQTKKLILKLNCTVSNGIKTIQLNDVKGTFAVAIPTF